MSYNTSAKKSPVKKTPNKTRVIPTTSKNSLLNRTPDSYSQATKASSVVRNAMWNRRWSQNVATKTSLHSSAVSIDGNNLRTNENLEDSRSFSKDSRFSNNFNFDMTFSNKFKSDSKELEIREVELESDASTKQINPFEISNFESLIAKSKQTPVSNYSITL